MSDAMPAQHTEAQSCEDDPKREAARARALLYLADQETYILEMVCMLARAMQNTEPYVFCVEIPRSGSIRLTNFEDDLKLARFFERFARAARRSAAP